MKFETLYKKWLGEQKYLIKQNTYNYYEFMGVKHIIPYFKNFKLSEINNIKIHDFALEKLSNGRLNNTGGLAPSTVNEIIIILKLIIKYGFKIGGIKYFEITSLQLKDTKLKVTTVFSNKEIDLLCKYLTNNYSPKNQGLLIAIYTGIRIGELSALKYSDIGSSNIKISKTLHRIYSIGEKSKIVTTTPKSKKANRMIPINNKLEINKQDNDFYILTNSINPMEPRTIRQHYKKVLEKLDIPYRPFHYIRHTFATRLINNTGDYKVVSELLGHSSVSITLDIYMHSDMNSKVKCINLF